MEHVKQKHMGLLFPSHLVMYMHLAQYLNKLELEALPAPGSLEEQSACVLSFYFASLGMWKFCAFTE